MTLTEDPADPFDGAIADRCRHRRTTSQLERTSASPPTRRADDGRCSPNGTSAPPWAPSHDRCRCRPTTSRPASAPASPRPTGPGLARQGEARTHPHQLEPHTAIAGAGYTFTLPTGLTVGATAQTNTCGGTLTATRAPRHRPVGRVDGVDLHVRGERAGDPGGGRHLRDQLGLGQLGQRAHQRRRHLVAHRHRRQRRARGPTPPSQRSPPPPPTPTRARHRQPGRRLHRHRRLPARRASPRPRLEPSSAPPSPPAAPRTTSPASGQRRRLAGDPSVHRHDPRPTQLARLTGTAAGGE